MSQMKNSSRDAEKLKDKRIRLVNAAIEAARVGKKTVNDFIKSVQDEIIK